MGWGRGTHCGGGCGGLGGGKGGEGGKGGAKGQDGFGRGGDVDWLSEEKIDFDSPLSSKSSSAVDLEDMRGGGGGNANMDSEQLLDQLLREMSQDKQAASKAPAKSASSSSFSTSSNCLVTTSTITLNNCSNVNDFNSQLLFHFFKKAIS